LGRFAGRHDLILADSAFGFDSKASPCLTWTGAASVGGRSSNVRVIVGSAGRHPSRFFTTLAAAIVIDVDGAPNEIDRRYRRTLFAFLAAPKECPGSVRWRRGNHADYFIAQLRLNHPDHPKVRARVMLQSHTYYEPRKYSFALLYGPTPVVRLDIAPRHSHRNLLNRTSVSSTHWHYYPCSEAIPDNRTLLHKFWFDEFLERCNITLSGSYAKPIHDKEQPRLI
jgi:hypothetical protein